MTRNKLHYTTRSEEYFKERGFGKQERNDEKHIIQNFQDTQDKEVMGQTEEGADLFHFNT